MTAKPKSHTPPPVPASASTDAAVEPASGTEPRRLTKRRPPRVAPQTLSRLERIRLVMLGFVLAGLAFYAWRTHRWYGDVGEIYNALRMEDSRRALALVGELDRSWGRTGEGHFLRARAHRYLEDIAATELAIDLATAAGYNRPRLEHEQQLLEVQTVLPDIGPETFQATLTSIQADLDENAIALARGYLRLGRIDSVERLLEAWRSQQTDNHRTHFVAGTVAMRLNRVEDAKREFEAGYAVEPRYVPLWLALGNVYWTSNEPSKAYEFFDRYAAARPDDPQGEGGRIETLLALGEYQKVVDFFKQRDEPLDINSQARIFYAKALSGVDRHQEVVETLAPLIAAWPQDVEANQTLALAYQALGQPEKAIEHANRAQEALPITQQIPELRGAIAADYANAAAHAQLGHILLHQSSRPEGLHHLMTAYSLNPSLPQVREDIARYYEAAGDAAAAAQFRGPAPTEGSARMDPQAMEAPQGLDSPGATPLIDIDAAGGR